MLRKVDHLELIAGAVDSAPVVNAAKSRGKKTIAAGDLADVFGIEMAEAEDSHRGLASDCKDAAEVARLCVQDGFEEKAEAGCRQIEKSAEAAAAIRKGPKTTTTSSIAAPQPRTNLRHASGSSKQRRKLAAGEIA